ncbi:MAG: TIGR04149 family rSAM-modified RiPP [Tannerellaceae bacterium]|nr:TIGR04149 family rSAM-modified RiPP [Tannerellaceae bacterium]
MKKVKKLSLKKETIAILDDQEMNHLIGGSVAISCTSPSTWGNCNSMFGCGGGGYPASVMCGGGGSGSNNCPTPSTADNTCTRWPSDGYAC